MNGLFLQKLIVASPFNIPSHFLSNTYKMAQSSASVGSFPSGSWTLYFHDPADTTWTPDSYKRIGTFNDFQGLWGALNTRDSERYLAGMFIFMKDPFLPLWEHRSNIHGGSYCIKVPEVSAFETFQRYAAAAILNLASKEEKNNIVGVTISPKKGFHIMKVWNLSSKLYNNATDINIYGEGVKAADVLYRPHVDQKM